jgi:predicted RNA-binding protein YlqC (UPF0109 family)
MISAGTFDAPRKEERMKDFLEEMARRLVEHSDKVRVDLEEQQDRLIFRLHVDPADVGKVIGKQGRNAQAMRTLMIAVAAREGKRAMLEIIQ